LIAGGFLIGTGVAIFLDLVESKGNGGKALSLGVAVFGAGVASFYMALRKEETASVGTVAAPRQTATPEMAIPERIVSADADRAFVRNLYGTKAPSSQTPGQEAAPERKDLRADQRTCPGCGHVVSRYAEQCPKCKERLNPS
jgi:hypothetical protein